MQLKRIVTGCNEKPILKENGFDEVWNAYQATRVGCFVEIVDLQS